MPKISNEMAWLLDVYDQSRPKITSRDASKIKLSQLISKLGFFYEKLRNAIDYNEEHLVRRNSLERFLRRHLLFLQEKSPFNISQGLIYEFIRAKYLPNDILPETLINEIAQIIKKYLIIIHYVEAGNFRQGKRIVDWLINVASNDIDVHLAPNAKEMAMVNFMYSEMVGTLAFTKINIDEKEKNLQIYIAVLRTLNKADKATLRFCLLKLYAPDWDNFTEEKISEFCGNLKLIIKKIEQNLIHPLGFQLTRLMRTQSVFFSTLKEAMDKNQNQLPELLADPKAVNDKMEAIAEKNYQKIKGKLIRSIFRIIIYILLTKTVLAFVLELPYDYFILQTVNWRALIINVVFHPSLMFFIAMTISVPSKKNTKIILKEIEKIIYGGERKIVFKPKKIMRRNSVGFIIFNAIYLILFAVSFGLVIAVLRMLQFNLVSGVLFVFFLTVVSFFGFHLRNFANQLSVLPRKDNLFNFVVSSFTLPIIRVGRFFSNNFSKINIFLFILDFLIETPFKMLVEFLEKTVSFIREKREEIVE